ncbi:MAG: endonuclease III [Ignavibacteria bacterium]|nr:endonuclease III [Ignavibacteria bacterium]
MQDKILKIVSELEKKYKSNNKPSKGGILDTLIATKLSQNTTDKTSYIAYKNLKKKYKNWGALTNASLREIKEQIKVCGMADTKSKDIKNMLNNMKKNYGTLNLDFLKKYKTEKIYDELLQYKGIGVKTVSCVLAFSMGRKVFPVDTHIHRVLNRLGIVKTKSPEDTFEKSEALIPGRKKISFHRNLIKFGREICKAVRPLCGLCVLYDYCEFIDKEDFYNSKAANKENNFLILDNI